MGFFSSTAEDFPELTYANPDDPLLKRWIIRRIEKITGRDDFAQAYRTWREEYWQKSDRPMADMLRLAGLGLEVRGKQFPPKDLPDGPLLIVANHPFGIGDGIAVMSLAEQLGRPIKIFINSELLKVQEIRPYSLPVRFDRSPEARAVNMQTKDDAIEFMQNGGVVVIFPGGGVATARNPFGPSQELPWRSFAARLVQLSNASVLPIFFHGQNSRLFHIASHISMMLRTSLLIREFRRLCGSTIVANVGEVIPPDRFKDKMELSDRHELLSVLQDEVMSLKT